MPPKPEAQIINTSFQCLFGKTIHFCLQTQQWPSLQYVFNDFQNLTKSVVFENVAVAATWAGCPLLPPLPLPFPTPTYPQPKCSSLCSGMPAAGCKQNSLCEKGQPGIDPDRAGSPPPQEAAPTNSKTSCEGWGSFSPSVGWPRFNN